MSKPIILPLAAGALLSLGCGGPASPPGGSTEPPPDVGNGGLPTWNDLDDPGPPTTNPPIPRLITTPDGRCFRFAEDARRGMPAIPGLERVYRPSGDAYVGTRCGELADVRGGTPCGSGDLPACEQAPSPCGAPIVCPAEAADVLAAWEAERARRSPNEPAPVREGEP